MGGLERRGDEAHLVWVPCNSKGNTRIVNDFSEALGCLEKVLHGIAFYNRKHQHPIRSAQLKLWRAYARGMPYLM